MINIIQAKRLSRKNKKLYFFIIFYKNPINMFQEAIVLAEAEVYAIGTLKEKLGSNLGDILEIKKLTQKEYLNIKKIYYRG